MHVIIGLAIGLIIAGLVMTWLSTSVRQPTLMTVVYWVGVVLIIVGLVLLLTPVLIWLNTQLREMFGLNRA